MSNRVNKRLITHKEIDGWLDKQGKFDVDVFNLFFVTYYEVGTDPLKTGEVEIQTFLEDIDTVRETVLDDGRDAYDNNQKIWLMEYTLGEKLVSQYDPEGNSRQLTSKDKEHINDMWWGSYLSKATKAEFKKRLHKFANQMGNIVLRQEHIRLKEEKQNPPTTYAEALTHLRNKGTINVSLEDSGRFDIWYKEDEYQSGYLSEYMGNIVYDNARTSLGATINGMTDRDENNIKKIKYKLL